MNIHKRRWRIKFFPATNSQPPYWFIINGRTKYIAHTADDADILHTLLEYHRQRPEATKLAQLLVK